MKMLSKTQLQKITKITLRLFIWTGWGVSFLLSGCGSGSGGGTPPAEEKVSIKGTMSVDAQTLVFQGAMCRFIDLNGGEQAVASADEAGVFTLEVPADIEGYIRCNPTGLDNLSLSAYCSTQGAGPGDILEDADVTMFSTLAAQIMATEDSTDPAGRNAELLAAMDGGQDPDLNLVVKVATRLYSAMLDHNLDVTFAGDAGGIPADGNGISGQVDAGGQSPDSGETSVLADAQCTYIADNNLGDGGSLLYPSALADFLDDGHLSRSDLAPIHTEINAQNIGQEEEISQAFKQVFAGGPGAAYGTSTDVDGIYSMAVPPNVSGYVRCVPKDRETLVLAAYVPGRPKGESLEGQDVNPATTLHAHRIAARLRNLADQQITKENFLEDISGLETQVLYDDQAVSGFQLRSGTVPAEKNVGLAAFSATALYNLLYRSNTGGEYLVLLDAFCRERGLDPETFTDQGLTPEEARAFTELLDQAIAQTQSTLGTLLDDALSTARVNVTVTDIKGGNPLAGATVTLVDDIACSGCSGHTNAYGGVSLTVAGLTDPTRELTIVARDAEGNETLEAIKVVPLATVETEVSIYEPYTLTVQPTGNGSGYIYIPGSGGSGGPIYCRIEEGQIMDEENIACSAQIAHGATVTLIAEGYFGSVSFDGWQGSACNHTEPVCTVTMDQNHTITAVFSKHCSNAAFLTKLIPRWGAKYSSNGGNGAIDTNYSGSCALEARSSVDWITVGDDNAEEPDYDDFDENWRILPYSVAANPDPNPRTGTITLFEHPIVITQDGRQCVTADYEITPVSTIFTAAGGTGTMEVRAPEGCTWQASADNDWITITSGDGEHRGNGTVTYAVPENPDANERVGDINLLGKHHAVAQEGVAWRRLHGVAIHGEGNGSGNIFSEWSDIVVVNGHSSFSGPTHFQDMECQITNGDAEGKCYSVFRTNTVLGLNAEPDEGSIFLNWTGACTGSDPFCSFRVSAENQTMGAHFLRSHAAELLFDFELEKIDKPLYIGENNNLDARMILENEICIENRGIEDASPFSVGFYISSDQNFDENDTRIADSRYMEAHSAGEKQYFYLPETITIPANLPPGQAFLLVVLDELNTVAEDLENNNTARIAVELAAPESEDNQTT